MRPKLNKPARPVVGVFSIALCLALLLGLYQNCAPSGSISPPAVSEGDQDHIVRALGDPNSNSNASSGSGDSAAIGDADLAFSVDPSDPRAITSKSVDPSLRPAEDCAFVKLQCFRKIYSPAVDNSNGTETLCLDDTNAATCLTVVTNSYNTRHSLAACEACGPESAKPGGEYNREEYTCWMGDPNLPTTSAFALRSTFREAVTATRALCGAH